MLGAAVIDLHVRGQPNRETKRDALLARGTGATDPQSEGARFDFGWLCSVGEQGLSDQLGVDVIGHFSDLAVDDPSHDAIRVVV